MHNIQIKKIETQDETKIVNLEEAEKITGSGLFSWGGAAIGGVTGGATGGLAGAIEYPVTEGFELLTTGKSDFSWQGWGGKTVGKAASGAVLGAGLGKGIGKFIEGLGSNTPH